MRSEADLSLLSKTLQLTQLGGGGGRGVPENKAGALSCRSAEPSPGLLTGLGPHLEAAVNLPLTLVSAT